MAAMSSGFTACMISSSALLAHFLQFFEVDATQPQGRAGGDQQFAAFLCPTQYFACKVCFGYANESFRLRFG